MEYKTLAEQIATDCNISPKDVDRLVGALTRVVGERATEMDTITLPSFGNFEPKKRLERISVNPATGRRLLLPPKIVLGFRPSSLLKQKIRN